MPRISESLRFRAAVALCCAALAYIFVLIVREPIDHADFRYVWLAGDMWSKGASPYGPPFVKAAQDHVFNVVQLMTDWVYPPHWYLIAVTTASLSPVAAFRLAMALELAMVLAGAWLLWRAAEAAGYRIGRLRAALLLAFTLSSTGVVWGIRTGQPVLPAIFGLCLIIYALATARSALLVVGIVLAMLKPHLGLPFVAALVFMPRAIPAIAMAGVIVLLLSLPAMLSDTPIGILRAMLGSGYAVIPYNQPGQMNGLAHLSFRFGIDLSMAWSAILACLCACAGVAMRRTLRDYVLICAASTAFLVTAHAYDMTVLYLMLPFAGGVPMIVAFAMIWRAENLARLSGVPSADILTIAGAIVFVAVLAEVWTGRRRRPAPRTTREFDPLR